MRCPLVPLAVLIAVQLLSAAISAQDTPINSDRERLLAQLRHNRRRNLEYLYSYAVEGRFPKNEDFPGKAVPYFKDQHGNLCAVAYLMVQSGLSEAADRVAMNNNHVRIENVTEGPVLDWMLMSGFTQEECALIQPCYRGRMVVNVSYEQLDMTAARIRVDGKHVVPPEYYFRPHFAEIRRVRRHLMSVYRMLVLKSHTSLETAHERVTWHERRVSTFHSEPGTPRIEWIGGCSCGICNYSWHLKDWERGALFEKAEDVSIATSTNYDYYETAPTFDPTAHVPIPPRIRMRFID